MPSSPKFVTPPNVTDDPSAPPTVMRASCPQSRGHPARTVPAHLVIGALPHKPVTPEKPQMNESRPMQTALSLPPALFVNFVPLRVFVFRLLRHAKNMATLAILAIYPKKPEKNPKPYMANPWQPMAHKLKNTTFPRFPPRKTLKNTKVAPMQTALSQLPALFVNFVPLRVFVMNVPPRMQKTVAVLAALAAFPKNPEKIAKTQTTPWRSSSKTSILRNAHS